MARSLIIPAHVMLDVRCALISYMGGSLEELDEVITRPEHEHHPEWFAGARKDLELLWELLDHIGWGGTSEEREVEIDLAKYGMMLTEAVHDHVPLYDTWEEEADASDKWRAEHGKPPRKEEILRRGAALRELAALLPAGE
jgi:hypothetical protein